MALRWPTRNFTSSSREVVDGFRIMQTVEGCDYSLVDATAAAQSTAPRHVPSATQRLPQSRWTNRYHFPGLQPPSR
jgi:hypothetical protein